MPAIDDGGVKTSLKALKVTMSRERLYEVIIR